MTATAERPPERELGAANDNRPENPTVVDLPPPTPEQVERVVNALADVLVRSAILQFGLATNGDDGSCAYDSGCGVAS